MTEFILRTVDILEDQVYLLNLVRYILAKNNKNENNSNVAAFVNTMQWSDYFLDPQDIVEIKTFWENRLFLMKPESENSCNLAVALRMICNCNSLLWQLYSQTQWNTALCNACKTDVDIDMCLGNSLIYTWSRCNLTELWLSMQRVLDFLVIFGSLQVLPSGVFTPGFKCYKCRQKTVLEELNEVNLTRTNRTSTFGCTQHVIRSRQTEEKETDIKVETIMNSDTKNAPIRCDDENNLEQLSIGKRIARNQKQIKLRETRNLLRLIQEKYLESQKEYTYLSEPKWIATELYATVGRMLLFLKKREEIYNKFVSQITTNQPLSFDEDIKAKFIKSLTMMQLDKIDSKLAQEEIFRLFLDPITVTERTKKLIRPSVLAKYFLLSFGVKAEEIALMTNKINSINVDTLLKAIKKFSLEKNDRFHMVVSIVYAYNKWLYVQDIPKCFHLKMYRVDTVKDVNSPGIYFLYDNEIIGLSMQFNNEYRLYSYSQVVDLCLTHLTVEVSKHTCLEKFL